MRDTVLVDANIIIRFFLNDHPKLSPQAKLIFFKAEKGETNLYLDEVVVAEVIWTLSSFYKVKKSDIIEQFKMLLAQKWILNPRKNLILKTLDLYNQCNLDYIDCWIFVVSKSLEINLETFDKGLGRLRPLKISGQMGKARKKKQSPKR